MDRYIDTQSKLDPMKSKVMKHYSTIASAVFAIALGIVLDRLFDLVVDGENSSHAAGHLTYVVPAFLFAFALFRFSPPPKPTNIGRLSRKTLIVGLLTLGIGGSLEAIGAFGRGNYDSGFDPVTAIHDLGLILTFLGMITISISIVLVLLSLGQRRIPRNVVILICALAGAVLVRLVVGGW